MRVDVFRMQIALQESRHEALQQATARARSLATFYGAGGLINVVSTAIPGWQPAHPWGLLAIAVIALSTAASLVAAGPRVPRNVCHVLVVIGSGLIGGCIASAGGAMTLAYAFFITWVAVYAANWFPRRQVALHLVVALAFEAAALWEAGLTTVLLPACLVTMGSCVAAADVVHRLQVRVRELAERDPLTGAANRRGLSASLLTHSPDGTIRLNGKSALTLIALDLDGFKTFNDTYGHADGDAVLRICVTAWRELLGAGEMCARLGGDEFVLVCRRDPDAAASLVAAARASVPRPLRVSAGVATARDGEELASLFERADAALYLDKTIPHQRINPASTSGIEPRVRST